MIRLAYNLVTAFQRTCLPESWQTYTLQKLRFKLFLLPGELTRPQNRPILRLKESPPIQRLVGDEELYCGRGDMENRIKEQFSLFADRVSTETMRGNQMRLYLSTMTHVLVSGLRRNGLKGTELAEAPVSTIRTKLLKIGAQIRVTVRKVWVSMASSYPWQELYGQVWANLRC